MSKYTKVIAALGVAAGLGVASLPLGAFATQYTRTGTVEVELTVPDSLIVKIDDKPAAGIAAGATQAGDKIEFGLVPAGTHAVAEDKTAISVYSSAANSFTLTAEGTALTTTENGGDTIAPFASVTALSDGGTEGWGIKVTPGDGQDAISGAANFGGNGYYMPTAAGVIDARNIAATAAETCTYEIEYGANVDAGAAAGTYTGTATYVVTSPNN